MKAIIVPGVTDLNKGDQALVWESHRLLTDTGVFSEIKILTNGDTPEELEKLCGQSETRGFEFCHNILKHPRRGKHAESEYLSESRFSVVRLAKNALLDLVSRSFLLLVCNNDFLVRFFFGKEVARTIEEFKACDLVAVKGGGFIHAYGERRAPYIIWFFLFYIRLALRLKKKIVFLPNSFGPFEGITVAAQVKKTLGKCGLIYARENVSAVALSELLGREIPVRPDLGFFLQTEKTNKVQDIHALYSIDRGDVIGITVRPWRFPGARDPAMLYSSYMNSIVTFAKYLVDSGYRVAFCNQSIGPNEHEDDRNAISDALALLEKYVESGQVFWINEDLSCSELKYVYSKFYAFVGTRFHSVIFSLTSRVPALAIGYGGNKAKGIMSDVGVDEFTVPIEKVNADVLIELFEEVELNRAGYLNNVNALLRDVDVQRGLMVAEIVRYMEA